MLNFRGGKKKGKDTLPTYEGGGDVGATPHPIPYALHPSPHTLRPAPHTLRPVPHTLHPYTLHPTFYTLHPTPFALHPTPDTLHPTPYALQPTPFLNQTSLTSSASTAGGPKSEWDEARLKVRRKDAKELLLSCSRMPQPQASSPHISIPKLQPRT